MDGTRQPGKNRLAGRRIIITRARGGPDAMTRLLSARGAIPVQIPLIECCPVVPATDAQTVLSQIGQFDWIVFTSGNGVRLFFRLLAGRPLPEMTRFACVGPQTAETLERAGYRPDFVPTRHTGEDLANELGIAAGGKVLYPGPRQVSSGLPGLFEQRGVTVMHWPVYETLPRPREEAAALAFRGVADAVIFASPSAVASFCSQYADCRDGLKDKAVACIGSSTTARAAREGIQVDVVPSDFTADGLVEALTRHFQPHSLSAEGKAR